MSALATIATAAAEKNLSFVLAGGHAVIAHGHPRTTFDLDLIVNRDDRPRWMDFARAQGYDLFREGPTFLQFNPPGPGLMPLDLMLVGPDTFAKLVADSGPAPEGAAGARVVSLRHLLALKCHAIRHGHPGRIVKDADDVLRLVQANRLNVTDPDIKQIFLKHGTTEFYEKVRRLCSQP